MGPLCRAPVAPGAWAAAGGDAVHARPAGAEHDHVPGRARANQRLRVLWPVLGACGAGQDHRLYRPRTRTGETQEKWLTTLKMSPATAGAGNRSSAARKKRRWNFANGRIAAGTAQAPRPTRTSSVTSGP